MKPQKYQINFIDYTIDVYGKNRKITILAKSIDSALEKAYKKHPKMKSPSVSILTK